MNRYECIAVNSRIGLRHRLVRAESVDQAAELLFTIAAKSVYGRNALIKSVSLSLARNDSTFCFTGWIGYEPGNSLCVVNGKNIQITIKEKP